MDQSKGTCTNLTSIGNRKFVLDKPSILLRLKAFHIELAIANDLLRVCPIFPKRLKGKHIG